MADLRKFLDQVGVETLWEKIDEKFADADSTLAIFEAIGNELDELAATQSDWNQSDETAKDYIKNRTHYSYEGKVMDEVLFEGEHLTFYTSTTLAQYSFSTPLSLVEGTEYLVQINNTTIPIVFSVDNNTVYFNGGPYSEIGNSMTLATGSISFWSYLFDNTDVYLKIGTSKEGEIVVPLDEKYIPNTIARISDINNQSKGVGQTTEENGEIFNDYKNNQAAQYAHAEGSGANASGIGSHAEGEGTAASGQYSHAEGGGCTAKGNYSHAEGCNDNRGYAVDAVGMAAHAEGRGTQAKAEASHAEGISTMAEGNYSHVEGEWSIANGKGSHAEGYNTMAKGTYSHAEGYQTSAQGNNAHAEGRLTFAVSREAHAEGDSTFAGNGTIDVSNLSPLSAYGVGASAHAEGIGSFAKGGASHSEGYKTQATGEAAHAEGIETNASVQGSHAEGMYTSVIGIGSHAEGSHTSASGYYCHAEGTYTLASGYGAHAEGRGTSTKQTKATAQAAHAEGYRAEASGMYSHAEGADTLSKGDASHAEGEFTSAKGHGSHAEGGYGYKTSSGAEIAYLTSYNFTDPEDINHTVIGTLAIGSASHAEGLQTVAYGYGAHSEGWRTQASGNNSHAEGVETIASASGSHAEGINTYSLCGASHAEGSYTQALGGSSHAEGYNTIAKADCQHVQGKYNLSGTYAMAIGNGSADDKRSNAMEIDWGGNAKFAGDVVAYNTSYSLSSTATGLAKLKDEHRHPGYIKAKGTNTNISIPVSTITIIPLNTKIIGGARYKDGDQDSFEFSTVNSLPNQSAKTGGIICPYIGTIFVSGHVYYNTTINSGAKKGAYILCQRAHQTGYPTEEAGSQFIYEAVSSDGRIATGGVLIDVYDGDIIYLAGRSNVERKCDANGSGLSIFYID